MPLDNIREGDTWPVGERYRKDSSHCSPTGLFKLKKGTKWPILTDPEIVSIFWVTPKNQYDHRCFFVLNRKRGKISVWTPKGPLRKPVRFLESTLRFAAFFIGGYALWLRQTVTAWQAITYGLDSRMSWNTTFTQQGAYNEQHRSRAHQASS